LGQAALAFPRRGAGKPSVPFMALKRAIMLGELPAGQVLTELELAARYSCSQGTVREALLQLQDEGLVQRKGYRGTQVSPCTPEEAVEMFRIRQGIECRGVRRALQHPSQGLSHDLRTLMAAMVEAAAAEDELELAALDRDFHRRLFADAGLVALDPVLHRCLVHNHRFKISRSGGPRDLRQTAMRHEPIVAAVERGDAVAASDALFHHIATIVDFGPSVFPEAEA
jgi:GntR family transcriptional regulator, rspAB operon transcriptional repressor